MWPRTSRTGRADRLCAEAGFTLLEIVCVVAILAILVAIILPALPRGTSRARLEGFAVEAATLLKADRNAAMRRRTEVVTEVDAPGRSMRSGATGRVLRLPADVTFQATLAARCNGRNVGTSVNFLASGMSCGGLIALTRLGSGYQVSVNWLTGGIDIAPIKAQ